MNANVELDVGRPGHVSVKVDGVEMANICNAMTLTVGTSDESPVLTLGLMASKVTGTALADVHVSVAPEVHALLISAGWTAPEVTT